MTVNITLRQLRAACHLADTGKFTLAAQHMHITQSAFSTLIKELEQAIGLKLFDRHTRKVEMTAVGEEFSRVATRTLGDLDAAILDLQNMATLRQGRVRVACSTVIASSLLSPAIKQFRVSFPGVHFVVRDVAEEDITRVVKSQSVDFGIGTSLDQQDEVAETFLFKDRFIALCAREHHFSQRTRLKWSDLQDEPFIALAPASPIRQLIDRALAKEGIRLTSVVNEASFATTVLSLVSAGVGVSVLPINNLPYLPLDVHSATLVAPSIERSVSIFTEQGRSVPPAAAAFIDLLHQRVQPPWRKLPERPAAG